MRPALDATHRVRWPDHFPTVRIIVNGRDLRDLVRDVEVPFAVAEGHADLAGSYAGLDSACLTTQHFFGHGDGLYRGDDLEKHTAPNRVALFTCICGEVGCWPLVASIDVEEDCVVWRDFRQPFREDWRYEALGSFTFARDAYETALGSAAASFRSGGD